MKYHKLRVKTKSKTYPIYFGNNILNSAGRLIAENWSGLLASNIGDDPTLQGSMSDIVGINGMRSAEKVVWTGSNSDGSLNSNNCNGWTTNSGIHAGQVGHAAYSDNNVLSRESSVCSTTLKNPFYCICF